MVDIKAVPDEAQQKRLDALAKIGAVKRKRKRIEMVTRGENLLSNDSEFAEAGDASIMDNLTKLGMRALNPDEVANNVISQVQEQMDKSNTSSSTQFPFKLIDEFVPIKHLRDLNPSIQRLQGMIRITHDAALRQPISASGPLSRGKKAQLQVKENVLKACLATLYPETVETLPQVDSISVNPDATAVLQGTIADAVRDAPTRLAQPAIASTMFPNNQGTPIEQAKQTPKRLLKLKVIGPAKPPSSSRTSQVKKKLRSKPSKVSMSSESLRTLNGSITNSKSAVDKELSKRTRKANLKRSEENHIEVHKELENESKVNCPICSKKQFPATPDGEAALSRHVDRCLRQSRASRGKKLDEESTNMEVEQSSSEDSGNDELVDEGGYSGQDGYDSNVVSSVQEEAADSDIEDSDIEDSKVEILYDDDWDDKAYACRILEYFSIERKWRSQWTHHVQSGCTQDEADMKTQADALEQMPLWKEEIALELQSNTDVVNSLASYIRNAAKGDTKFSKFLHESYDADVEMIVIANEHRIPRRMYIELFEYQRKGVDWILGLRSKGCGGILGDEMGLGKTVQVAAALAALKCSEMIGRSNPVLIVSPATTLSQWVQELHKWHPTLRVLLMHSSGAALTAGKWNRQKLVSSTWRQGDVLITTYQGLRMSADLCLPVRWSQVVLDEGHKIRNPDADITLVCKQLQTVNRIILSGAPIQNNLRELWSLFDFVFPGRLGTLPMFENQFSIPINAGGFTNASPMQVQMAYKCAIVLKETIAPFLLRRMKKDVVSQNLPKKVEQVLFCNITQEQRSKYQQYLNRPEIQDIIHQERVGRKKMLTFRAIRGLQNICNHPDLILHEKPDDFGAISRSGKLLVLKPILELWRKQGHRVLLFSQGVVMLNILEEFVKSEGYPYYRMDGTTPIKKRQPLIDKFNDLTNDVFVFCLTTKVGGLGVNLIGANRVLIFDPDWNPSTDLQARERAWRLGQKRPVTIYRLITSGTLEEKIYHRQIFKQFLTNKILHDPRQKRFFKLNDLRDLFTLGRDTTHETTGTETGSLFVQGTVDVPKPTNTSNEDGEESRITNNTNSEVAISNSSRNGAAVSNSSRNGAAVSNSSRNGAAVSNSLSNEVAISNSLSNEVAISNSLSNEVAISNKLSNEVAVSNKLSNEVAISNSLSNEAAIPVDEIQGLERIEYATPMPVPDETNTTTSVMEGETQNGDEDEVHQDENNAILQRIFDQEGFRHAFDHDHVERASRNNPERQFLDEEASRVARRAAAALARDQARCKRLNGNAIDKPTWTGQRGSIGGPSTGLGSLSSGSLLEKMRNRSWMKQPNNNQVDQQEPAISLGARLQSGSSAISSSFAAKVSQSSPSDNKFDKVMRSLRIYLRSKRGHGATTKEILKQFKNKMLESEAHIFREMLREMAELRQGTWVLKTMYL